MAVTTTVADGLLTVTSTEVNPVAITVTVVDGNVKVNGGDPDNGVFAAGAISAIQVNGGPGVNHIDLTGVTAADFTALTGGVTVTGGDSNDRFLGSEFAESINGGGGNDSLEGGGGNDSLTGGTGNDTLDGGTGTDRFVETAIVIDATLTDTTFDGNGNDRLVSIEEAGITGTAGDDLIDTFDVTYPTTISGTDGDDTLIGGSGPDQLIGGEGDDSLDGAEGNDSLEGGNGVDTVDGSLGNDTVAGGAGNDSVAGGAEVNHLVALSGNNLLSLRGDAPGTVLLTKPVTGLQAGENLVGMDFRPATGLLVVLTNQGRLYTIDPVAGAAGDAVTLAADPADATNPFTALSGTSFAIDFNPVTDRLRILSDTEQNLSIDIDTGLVTTDADINPAGNIVAAAYTNSFGGAGSTTLFTIDSATDTLNTQNPPNSGTQVAVGALGVDASELAGFDIAAGANNAFAVLNVGGVAGLYSINLTTGAATAVGNVGDGTGNLSGLAIVTDNDQIVVDEGDDTLAGGVGQDTAVLTGSDAADNFAIGVAGDAVQVQRTGDAPSTVSLRTMESLTVNAGGGDDTITVNDLTGATGLTRVDLDGGDGNDRVDALAQLNALFAISMTGGAGNDTLIGGSGNDTMSGGAGNDQVNGAAGSDLVDFSPAASSVKLNLRTARNNRGAKAVFRDENNQVVETDTILAAEAIIGTAFDDSITSRVAGTTLIGGGGNDSLRVQALGAHLIDGGAGNDTLRSKKGQATLVGGTGNDSMIGGTGIDSLVGGDGDDTLKGGKGTDTLDGGPGTDTLISDDTDTLID